MNHPTISRSLLAGLALLLAPAPPLAAQDEEGAPKPDLLRLRNGDVLQGSFQGITPEGKLQWQHPDVEERLEIDLKTLQRIGLNGGSAFASLPTHSYAALENGDRFAGTVMSLDGEALEIDTPFAGVLRLPRKHLSKLSPNPHGGLVHYLGPYSTENWAIYRKDADKEDAGKEDDEKAAEEEKEEAAGDEKAGEKKAEDWTFAGGAWYSRGTSPLYLKNKLPDRTRISFKMEWRSRLNALIAIHATMEEPEPEPKDEDEDAEKEEAEAGKKAPNAPRARRVGVAAPSSNMGFASTYGASYVLTLYSNYAILYRVSFDENGKGVVDRLSSTNSHVRLTDVGEAEFELRCDREEASITLYINGAFVGQWSDPQGYAGLGSHLAFATRADDTRLRVSDVAITSWNGMLDSALSMESAERDVLLLTNGTDRYSGDVTGIKDGILHLRGAFAEMHIPVTDIEEIRFARDKVSPLPEPTDGTISLVLQPVGRLSIVPRQATAKTLSGTLITGEPVEITLKHVNVLEFTDGMGALDEWDQDF